MFRFATNFKIGYWNMRKLAVVAFGGNALLQSSQKGTIDEQEQNAFETSEKLMILINEKKYNLVITHGNGPQVGNLLLNNTAGNKLYGLPEMPLDVCVAYSQGFIGYIIEQQLHNVLMQHDMDRDIITIITQVLVNKDDQAFENPTKPIGPYYSKEEADKIMAETESVSRKMPVAGDGEKWLRHPSPW